MSRLLLALLIVVPVLSSCELQPREQVCIDAEACDAALERPFNDFDANDPVFGDAGSCWQNNESKAPCVLACQQFLADQKALAEAQNNDAVVLACGGAVDGAEGEGEGEGE